MITFKQYNEKKSSYLKKVQKTVDDSAWQKFRLSLKGLSTSTKLSKLSQWVSGHSGADKAKLQADNYRNALKRGGQLK